MPVREHEKLRIFSKIMSLRWVNSNAHSSWGKQWMLLAKQCGNSGGSHWQVECLEYTSCVQSLHRCLASLNPQNHPWKQMLLLSPFTNKKTVTQSSWVVCPKSPSKKRGGARFKPRLKTGSWNHCTQGPWPDSRLVKGTTTDGKNHSPKLSRKK